MQEHDHDKPGLEFAALAASAMGAIVATTASPGSYTWVDLAVTITLVTTAIGFAWNSVRSGGQSAAFGMIMGVMCVPGCGFLIEAIQNPPWIANVRECVVECGECNCGGANASEASTIVLFLCWATITLVIG